jgi:hypothetical protein
MAVNPACAKEADSKKAVAETKTVTPTAPQQTPNAAGQQAVTANSAETAPAIQEKKTGPTVDVYLFHGTYRCYSCNLMEEITLEAIEESLQAEKQAGTVVFHHVNVEEDKNKHFIKDYKIAAISIILSQKTDGKEKQWKNLDQVWLLLKTPDKFKAYVLKEIENYLKG